MNQPAQRPPRLFRADEILSGRAVLDGYPFRYVLIGPNASAAFGVALGGRSGANNMLDLVLSAAELLETRGWQLRPGWQRGLHAPGALSPVT